MSMFGPATILRLGERSSPYDKHATADAESPHEEIATLWIGNAVPGTTDSDLAAVFGDYGPLLCCFLLKKLSPQGHLSGFVRYSTRAEASVALTAARNGNLFVNGSMITAKWASQNSKPLHSQGIVSRQDPKPSASPVTDEVLQRVKEIVGLASAPVSSSAASVASTPVAVAPPAAAAPAGGDGEEIATLWVGNMIPGTTDEELVAHFGIFGSLLTCFLFKKLSPQGQMSGFVRYNSRQEALRALQAAEADRIVISGAVVRARWATENSKVTKGLPELLGSQQPAAAAAPPAEVPAAVPAPAASSGTQAALQALQNALQQAMEPQKAAELARGLAAASAGLSTNLEHIRSDHMEETSHEEYRHEEYGHEDYATPASGAAHPVAMQAPPPGCEDVATLWVGNVSPGSNDADLAAAMSPFGGLVCCFLLKKLSPQGQLSGFVRYTSRAEAAFALDEVVEGRVAVQGSTITAKWAAQNSQPLNNPSAAQQAVLAGQDPGQVAVSGVGVAPVPEKDANGEDIATLWVGNALPGTTDVELAAAVAPFGPLVCCFLLKKLSQHGQLSGFIRYATRQQAATALEAIGAGRVIVNSSVITAKWATQNSKPLSEKQAMSESLGFLQQAAAPQQKQQQQQQQPQHFLNQTGVLHPSTHAAAPSAPVVSEMGEEITTLWVGNVNPGTPDQDLINTMAVFGQLVCCFLLKTVSPQGQLSGFARYATVGEAASALHATESGAVVVNGAVLKARWAKVNSKPLGQS